ncbi:hypothetical protein [Glaciimonas immobilis]|uniref:Uncharacterized protein n=1 Tax=Glaciimonas immobilis TaxID=728004 RepID=A0A840RMY7_9BURK|nr:hypothetical protein [Glaciimonas immobilis]KAF3996871.1 hypothetical protein HAV38_14300 [Glaciimonas immobilis]MBB5199677.1 hypothetical protein [Glaciimonas immobilis]
MSITPHFSKKFALGENVRYRLIVPEKKGNGFDSLPAKKRTNGAMPFFSCVCRRASSMGGGGGEAFGLAGFLFCASLSTLLFAAHPI